MSNGTGALPEPGGHRQRHSSLAQTRLRPPFSDARHTNIGSSVTTTIKPPHVCYSMQLQHATAVAPRRRGGGEPKTTPFFKAPWCAGNIWTHAPCAATSRSTHHQGNLVVHLIMTSCLHKPCYEQSGRDAVAWSPFCLLTNITYITPAFSGVPREKKSEMAT